MSNLISIIFLECTPSNPCDSVNDWDSFWSELSFQQRTHWETLGWTETQWDTDDYQASTQAFCYADLTPEQKNAVNSLGYPDTEEGKKKWNIQQLVEYNNACQGGKRISSFGPQYLKILKLET